MVDVQLGEAPHEPAQASRLGRRRKRDEVRARTIASE